MLLLLRRLTWILIAATAGLFFITVILPFKHRLIGKQDAFVSQVSLIKTLEKSDGIKTTRVYLPSVCANETCRVEYVSELQQKGEYPIPAIRHILWRNESVSEYFIDQVRSWQRIHPDWTYVLWRDQDLEPFVAAHFPGLLAKFNSLPHHITKVDMIRYMLLFKYGGTYADLDYRLVRGLDEFRRFHAVITREPEAHSLQTLSMEWPVKVLANPAFLMSAPGHRFYFFMLQQLQSRVVGDSMNFAGPFGLTDILKNYQALLPKAQTAMETVYVPPSRSFYPYDGNRLSTSKSKYVRWRLDSLKVACHQLRQKLNKHLKKYCTDVDNMDPITDESQPVVAIHDMQKPAAVYDMGSKYFFENLKDLTHEMADVKLGKDLI